MRRGSENGEAGAEKKRLSKEQDSLIILYWHILELFFGENTWEYR